MESNSRKWRYSVLLGMILVFHSVTALGQTGICPLDCFTAFTTCLGSTAGCTPSELDCRDGSRCRDGKCGNGTNCPISWSAACSPCIVAQGGCLQSCEGAFLPELAAEIRRARLEQGQERALLAKVERAEKELVVAVESAVKSLETFRKQVAAQAGKSISEKAAATLTEVAKRTSATLQSKGVPACVSTLTTVGELVPIVEAGQRMKD